MVTLTGTNFGAATGAKLNGVSLTGFTVDSPTQVHGTSGVWTGLSAVANTPATVTNAGGTGTLPTAWSYLPTALSLILLADAGVTGTTNVSTWADQSGSGNDFNQTVIGPALVANVINGKPVMRFTGGTMYLGDGSLTYSLGRLVTAAAYTYFVLPSWASPISTNSSNSYDNEAVFSDAVGGNIAYAAKSGGPTGIAYHWDGADRHSNQTIATNTFYLASVKYDGANINQWVNGVGLVSAAAGNLIDVGKNPRLGESYTGGAFFSGDLPALLFSKTAMPDGDRQAVESWLGHRYGIF